MSEDESEALPLKRGTRLNSNNLDDVNKGLSDKVKES